jgi:hypothetical protein
MAPPKKSPSTEPLKVHTVKLTPAVAEILQRLSQDASDALGWTVSSSAMIRALIRQAGKQPTEWVIAELYLLIEEEIARGRVWGSKKR